MARKINSPKRRKTRKKVHTSNSGSFDHALNFYFDLVDDSLPKLKQATADWYKFSEGLMDKSIEIQEKLIGSILKKTDDSETFASQSRLFLRRALHFQKETVLSSIDTWTANIKAFRPNPSKA